MINVPADASLSGSSLARSAKVRAIGQSPGAAGVAARIPAAARNDRQIQQSTACLVMATLLAMALQASSANGQSCLDFNKGVEAAMAADNDVSAQLSRVKATGPSPRFDVGVCNAAKQLRELAAAAANLGNQNCGLNTGVVGALGDMTQSAESDIKLFCAREVDTPRPVQPSANVDEGFIFPDSDRRRLTVGELRGLSADQLRIARNEIFARRGRYFKDEMLKAHFSQLSWYRPDRWDVTLNAIEQANVTLIRSLEKQ